MQKQDVELQKFLTRSQFLGPTLKFQLSTLWEGFDYSIRKKSLPSLFSFDNTLPQLVSIRRKFQTFSLLRLLFFFAPKRPSFKNLINKIIKNCGRSQLHILVKVDLTKKGDICFVIDPKHLTMNLQNNTQPTCTHKLLRTYYRKTHLKKG